MGNDEIKKIIPKAEKMEDSELENVVGGMKFGKDVIRVACCKCKQFFPVKLSSTSVKCPYCRTINIFEG